MSYPLSGCGEVSEASERVVVKVNKLEAAKTRYQKATRFIFFSLQILLANRQRISDADFTDRTEISNLLGQKPTLLHIVSLLSVTYKFSDRNSPNRITFSPKSQKYV